MMLLSFLVNAFREITVIPFELTTEQRWKQIRHIDGIPDYGNPPIIIPINQLNFAVTAEFCDHSF